MPYTLSPEQKVVANALLSSTATDIKYFDLDTAFGAVYQAILKALDEHKKVLIHTTSDENISISIDELISRFKLDSLTINSGSRSIIPDSDIITLRSVLKKNVDTTPIIEQILNNEKLNTDLIKVSNYYKAMDTKVLSERTFRDFSTSLIYHQKENNQKLHISSDASGKELIFNSQEYYNIKRIVSQASELYKSEFDLLDQLNLVSDVVWSYNEEKTKELRASLAELITESKDLVIKYKKTYDDLSKDAAKNVNKEVLTLTHAISVHQRECTAYHINELYTTPKQESKLSLFGKKQVQSTNAAYIKAFDIISGLIKNLSTEWFDELLAPKTEEITYGFITQFISEVKNSLPSYEKKLKQNLNNSLHRINRINTTSDLVKSLDERLTAFINKTDDLGFINQKFNGNTLSFIKQMELNHEISAVLTQCYNLIGKDSSYTFWKSFERSNSQLGTEMISALKALPQSEWSHAFDQWYNNQIKDTILSDLSIDTSKIKDLLKLNRLISTNEIPDALNKIQIKRLNAAENLKANSKELHNTLFKKKTMNPTSWNDIALTSRSFLQDFFPIHIDENLTHTSEYDLVISFSKRPEIMNDDLKVHHISPILAEDIENRMDSKDLFLYLNNYKYTSNLSELPNTEKLKASKKLAKFILSLNQQIKIYQLKTGNIISLLPTTDDVYFERKMDQFGIKSIDTSGSLYEKLTESILFTNRQPFLIIKDELINPDLHQHLLWQAELLEIFETAGYQILSLNTHEQLKDNEGIFEKIIGSLIDGSAQNIKLPQSINTDNQTTRKDLAKTEESSSPTN